jgi:hypothetical protein
MPILIKKIEPWSKKFFAYLLAALMLLVMLEVLILPKLTSAAQLTSRKVTLSTSSAASSAATTTYTFDFTTASTATIASIKIQACTTASGSCSVPTGWDEASSTLSSTTFSGSWTVSTATDGELRASATGASSTSSGVAKQIVFGNVQNPTTANETFFMRITTYTGSNWSTGPTDTGVVAASTAAQISVTASVDESLSLCVYSGANCGAGGTSIALGALSSSSLTTGTHKVEAGTNATSGYVLQYNGATLTDSGISQTITAIGGTAAASSTGSEQFGFNAGTYSGGSGAPGEQYDNTSEYAFVAGSSTTFASASGPSATTTYTLTYGANISSGTEAGSYSTTITYICTATF